MVLMDTLFGHKAEITCIDSLSKERCITSSQDKAVAIWKIPEQVNLQFKGPKSSIECVSLVNEDIFISGSQSGEIQLWSSTKRKPIFQLKNAHQNKTQETINWITSISALRYSDLFASGSSTGEIKFWKIDSNFQSFKQIKEIKMIGVINSLQFSKSGKFLIAGVGQEHKLGRWISLKNSKNTTAIIELPIKI